MKKSCFRSVLFGLIILLTTGCLAKNPQATATPFATPDFEATNETPHENEPEDSALSGEVDQAELSEEEISIAFTEETSTASQSAEDLSGKTEAYTQDGELSDDEIEDLEALYQESLEEVEYLLYLASIYSYYYGDLAGETLELLDAMEDELWLIVQLAEEYEEELNNVLLVIENGGEITEEMIATLEENSAEWYEKLDTMEGNADSWKAALQTEMAARIEEWSTMEVTELASTPAETLRLLHDYLLGVHMGLGDGVINAEELADLKQLAVNLIASLDEVKVGEADAMLTHIEDLTNMLVTGQNPAIDVKIEEIRESIQN